MLVKLVIVDYCVAVLMGCHGGSIPRSTVNKYKVVLIIPFLDSRLPLPTHAEPARDTYHEMSYQGTYGSYSLLVR